MADEESREQRNPSWLIAGSRKGDKWQERFPHRNKMKSHIVSTEGKIPSSIGLSSELAQGEPSEMKEALLTCRQCPRMETMLRHCQILLQYLPWLQQVPESMSHHHPPLL